MALYHILLASCVQFCCAPQLEVALQTLTEKLDDLTSALQSSGGGKGAKSAQVTTALQLQSNQKSPKSITYKTTTGREIWLQINDITTTSAAHVIVNAANPGLHAGGGVCGAIYGAAGSNELTQIVNNWKKSNNKPHGISVGEAALTGVPSGPNNKLNKNIRYIVHAVGPNCNNQPEKANWKNLLASAYTNSLLEASKKPVDSIAFPSISTAIFGCDAQEAAPIAIQAALSFFEQHPKIKLNRVVFMFWPDNPSALFAMDRYADILDQAFGIPPK